MKRFLFLTLLSAVCIISLSAQSSQEREEQTSQNRKSQTATQRKKQGEIRVTKFPEIPELTEKQKEKLVKILVDDQKKFSPLVSMRAELTMQVENAAGASEKGSDRRSEQIYRIDEQIRIGEAKSDKKIRSMLSVEQYRIFIQKKKDIEFAEID